MTLILAATPLGNPGDASARLKSAIENASIIAAEDSRRFHRLCADIEVTFTARVVSFFEGNEEDRTRELLTELKSGVTVLVVSDAGMPTISDPGFRLMRDAIAENIPTVVIPGPSAPTMAIALSGLPTDRFTFEGFAPRAQGARRAPRHMCAPWQSRCLGSRGAPRPREPRRVALLPCAREARCAWPRRSSPCAPCRARRPESRSACPHDSCASRLH